MVWFSRVFGGSGDGSIAPQQQQQQQQNGATESDNPSSSHGPPSPSPRLRKRNRRYDDGVHFNCEQDSDSVEGDAPGVSRRINFSQYADTSNDNNNFTDWDDEDDDEEQEEDVLNTTCDTVDTPIVEDVTNDDEHEFSIIGEEEAPGESERVYVTDAPELQHVQLERQHWRDMKWDPVKKKFYYEDGVGNAEEGIPAANGYKIVTAADVNDLEVRVVLDLSKEKILACYKGELDSLYAKLEQLEIPATVQGIDEHLFGANSRLMQTLARRLKKDPHEIHKFLSTVYFAAELGLPSKRLEQHPNIKFDEYMDTEALNSFWRDIADIGKNGDEPSYLWQDLEDALNEDCRELFLSAAQNNHQLRVALDDDKVHFQFSTMSMILDKNYLCGLSPQQHVKANRRGFTIDSAVSAATGHPLCFRARREGSSSVQNYQAMIKYMFQYKFSVAGAAVLALNNIVFCSDRGYWQVGIILFILRFGGAVFGTLMRMPWVPFTYDQKKPGVRRVINKNHGRNIFLAFGRWCNNLLKIMAFRSGTGSVSLAMDSDGDEDGPQYWELCFKNNGDRRWYLSDSLTNTERQLKAFRSMDEIVITTDEQRSINHHLSMLDVTMLTCQDMDFSWAMLRKFAFTSSSSAEAIKMAAPYVPQDVEARTKYETVLKYAGMEKDLSDAAAADSMSVDSEEADSPIDAALVTEVVKSMRAGRTDESLIKSKQDAQRILDAIESLSPSKLLTMLVALGIKADRASNKLPDVEQRKRLKWWTESIIDCTSASTYKFPYKKILDAKEVQVMLEARAGDAIAKRNLPGPNQNPTTKDTRIEALQHIDDDTTFQQSAKERDPTHNPLMYAILTGIVKRGFLQSLPNKVKKALRLGHQNESNLLLQYYKDSKNGRVPGVNLCDIKRPGMAMHDKHNYVRDSADGLGIEYREDGVDMDDDDSFDSMTSHPIECKCRAEGGWDGSLRQAKSIRWKVMNELDMSEQIRVQARGEAAYLKVSSSDQELMQKLIPDSSERIQILHHAYTYGCNRTTFLVGDPEGKVLFGLVVTFEDELLAAYGDVLEFLYDNGLNLFYSNDMKDLPVDTIKNIIRNNNALTKKYVVEDFIMTAKICQEMLPHSCSKIKHPIPACDMLVPHEYALWNISKGGSDTVTRFTWNCLPVLPIRTPQNVLVARYFMIYGVLRHRLVQNVTGTKKLDISSDTIQSVRERRNQRVAFNKSLGALSKFHLQRSSKQSPAEEGIVTPADFQRTPAPIFNEEEKDKQFGVDHSVLGQSTGSTPIGKGKGTGMAKKFLEKNNNYHEIEQRNTNCTGFVGRIYKQNDKKDGKFEADKQYSCDLCKTSKVTTMCCGCKRVLCFDHDRRERIIELLKGKDGDRLRKDYPALSRLREGDAPAFYTEIGMVNGRKFVMGMSCWHLAHPNHYLCLPCEDEDAQLSSVVAAGQHASSPQRNE